MTLLTEHSLFEIHSSMLIKKKGGLVCSPGAIHEKDISHTFDMLGLLSRPILFSCSVMIIGTCHKLMQIHRAQTGDAELNVKHRTQECLKVPALRR